MRGFALAESRKRALGAVWAVKRAERGALDGAAILWRHVFQTAVEFDFKPDAGKLRAMPAKLSVTVPACERPPLLNRTAHVEPHESSLIGWSHPRLMPA